MPANGRWDLIRRLKVKCCVCRHKSLRRADHSSIEVLPTIVRRCVRSRNLVNEEAMVHWGCRASNKQIRVNKTRECISLLIYFYHFPVNPLKKKRMVYIRNQSVPRSKHSPPRL